MIVKGTTCAGARRIAAHLSRTDTNERAEVEEIRGVAAEDLSGALREMEAVAAGTRTKRPFYHGSINPDAPLTPEQWAHAIDRMEAELGLAGQPRVVVVHEKGGREHRHIVWSRIDVERMAAISDSHNYPKHEKVARALEREFGHERVQGAHIERDGKERPKRTPSHAEMLQADRTGLTPTEVKEQITELWRKADNGPDLAKALWDAGYVLARGDRRDFVVIDPMGGTHSISRRVEGATAKDVRERLADLDPKRFPNVVDAKTIQQARQKRDAARSVDQDQRPEPVRVDEEARSKVPADHEMDWTSRGGMVEQQRSALEWAKNSHEEKLARARQPERAEIAVETQQAMERRRQRLSGEFVREDEEDLGDHRRASRDRGRSR